MPSSVQYTIIIIYIYEYIYIYIYVILCYYFKRLNFSFLSI